MQDKDRLQKCGSVADVLLCRHQRADGKVLLVSGCRLAGIDHEGKRASKSLFDESDVGVNSIDCSGHENLLGFANVDLGNWVRNSAPESHQKAGGPLWSCVQTAQT